MQVESANCEICAKAQAVQKDDNLAIFLLKTKLITAFVVHPSDWNTTGTVTPLHKLTEITSSLIFYWCSALIYKKIAFRVTNTNDPPDTIKKEHKNCPV